MTDLVIPFHDQSGSEELRLMLRSWQKNYIHEDGQFRVFIIGERPEWITNIIYIPFAKDFGAEFPAFRNTLDKLWTAVTDQRVTESFIYVYDDVFLMQPTDPYFFDQAFAMKKYVDHQRAVPKTNTYLQLLDKTLRLFTPAYSFETHMPRRLNKQLLKLLFRDYDLKNKMFILSTLYYNHFGFPPTMISNRYPRVCFYGTDAGHCFSSDDSDWIRQQSKGACIINSSREGFTPELKDYLLSKFPDKSIFEL